MLDEPFEVIWTERASIALEETHRYIASDNPTAAVDFIDDVRARVSQLSTLPEIGFKSKVRRVGGAIRELVVGRYRILYRPEPELKRVLILLMWHGSRPNPTSKDFES